MHLATLLQMYAKSLMIVQLLLGQIVNLWELYINRQFFQLAEPFSKTCASILLGIARPIQLLRDTLAVS